MGKLWNGMRSLRLLTIILFLCAALLPALLINLALPGYMEDSLITMRIEKMQNQCLILRNHLIHENYFQTGSPSTSIGAELDHISSLYDGRVQLINSSFRVVEDTFSLDKGKYCIDKNVLACFQGKEFSEVRNEEDHYVELTRLIQRESEEGMVREGVLLIVFSVQDVYDLTEDVTLVLNLVFLLIGLVALVVAFLLSKWITQPLRDVESTVVKITQGDMEYRLPEPRYHEMEKMTGAFNHMLDQLESQEESRQEFVSNVSHELKTPIAAIKVLADSLMGDEELPAEVYREFLGDIVVEIDRENDIITDLLDLVRVDRKKAELNLSKTNINEAVEATLTRLKPIAAAKNVEVVFESFRPVLADVDITKFNMVVTNLVENAIKYNNQDGTVHVSLNADHKFFYLKVADDGIGIPEEAQSHVFDRFYRVDKARSREQGGTGLGLSITKSIVLLHHGEIRLHSTEGQGSTFTVRIPLNYMS